MMVFLTLLTMAIGMIAVLAVVFVGLFEAPWPVLVVVLVVGLLTLQRLSAQVQSLLEDDALIADVSQAESSVVAQSADASTAGSSTAVTSGLKYRGVGYKRDRVTIDNVTANAGTPATSPTPEPSLNTDAAAPNAVGKTDAIAPVTKTVTGYYRGRRWERSAPALTNASSPHPGIVYRGRKVSPSADATSTAAAQPDAAPVMADGADGADGADKTTG